jgi:hypothetical protein
MGRMIKQVMIYGFVSVIVVVAILLNGYWFGVSDHNEQLPLIRRRQNVDYLSRDWFVNVSVSGNDVRWFYSHLMARLCEVFPEAQSFWIVYVLTFFLMGSGLYIWANHYSQNRAGSFLALIIASLNCNGTLGGSQLIISSLVPSFIAWAILIWGMIFANAKRWLLCGILLGMCALIHPLLGLWGFLLVFVLRISKKRIESWLLGATIFMMLASPVIVPLLPLSVEQMSVNDSEIVKILAYMRHPWHYVPSTWPVENFIQFGIFSLIIAILLWRKGALFSDLSLLLGVILVLCLVGTLFVEIIPVATITKLQPFRLTPFFQIVGALLIGEFLVKRLRGYLDVIVSLTGFLLLVAASFMSTVTPLWLFLLLILADEICRRLSFSWIRFVVMSIGIAMLIWLILQVYQAQEFRVLVALFLISIPFLAGKLDYLMKHRITRLSLTAIPALVSVMLLIFFYQISMNKLSFPDHLKSYLGDIQGVLTYNSALDDVAHWAQRNTAIDALFLITPSYRSFRVKAERALVVDFKAFPYTDTSMVEWLKRLESVVGRDDLTLGYGAYSELVQAYNSQELESLMQTILDYECDYVVVTKGHDMQLDVAYSNEDYLVYKAPQ